MEINTFKYKTLKLFYTIRGFFYVVFKLKEGYSYRREPNTLMTIYRGKRMFYESHQYVDKMYGVEVYSTNNKIYPYWQIGLFKWNKIEAKIITT